MRSSASSVGVVGYALLCGSSPWDARDPWELVQETIKMKTVNFAGRKFTGVSEQAKEFICWLMTPDPNQRPSSEQALRHPVCPHVCLSSSLDLTLHPCLSWVRQQEVAPWLTMAQPMMCCFNFLQWLNTPRGPASRPPTRPSSPNFEHGEGPGMTWLSFLLVDCSRLSTLRVVLL